VPIYLIIVGNPKYTWNKKLIVNCWNSIIKEIWIQIFIQVNLMYLKLKTRSSLVTIWGRRGESHGTYKTSHSTYMTDMSGLKKTFPQGCLGNKIPNFQNPDKFFPFFTLKSKISKIAHIYLSRTSTETSFSKIKEPFFLSEIKQFSKIEGIFTSVLF